MRYPVALLSPVYFVLKTLKFELILLFILTFLRFIKVRIYENFKFRFKRLKKLINKILFLFLSLVFISFLKPLHAQDAVTTDQEEKEFGFIQFVTETDSFFVVVDMDYNDPRFIRFAGTDSLKLVAGINHLTIIKPYYFDISFNIDVFADSTNQYELNQNEFMDNERNKYASTYPRLVWGGKAMVRSDSDTKLFVNENSTGIGWTVIESSGNYKLSGRAFNSKTVRTDVNISDNPQFQVVDFYYRPDKKNARLLTLLPGASQLYQKQPVKAGVFIGLSVVTIGLAFRERNKFHEADRFYDSNVILYSWTTDIQKSLEIGNRIEKFNQERQSHARNRNRLLAGFAVVYAANIIDGFIKPRIGYREEMSFDPYLDFDQGSTALGFNFRSNF